jgi:hypothetical protein
MYMHTCVVHEHMYYVHMYVWCTRYYKLQGHLWTNFLQNEIINLFFLLFFKMIHDTVGVHTQDTTLSVSSAAQLQVSLSHVCLV